GATGIQFAEYRVRVLGCDPTKRPYDAYAQYVAAIAIIAMAGVNIIGVRFSSWVQNISTIAKYVGLLLIVIVAIALGFPRTGGHFTPAAPAGSFSISAFGVAPVSVLL